MRVLVVDDASAIRYMLRILLEDAGMAVEEAASGLDALARIANPRAPRIDAVVLDQRMPDLTGLEVARELVLAGEHPQLFLYTSYLHPVQEAEAAELGVTSLVKTDLDELVGALRLVAAGAGYAPTTSRTVARTVSSGSPFST
ncbi:MAG: two component, sigma54 specific, transcriptional regulator, Fis family [Solirubrobacterales bacterium]|jgi:two-component system chemotaxis response regulator CheY|nr:two component, sigma54 specific, transcriptional regulator, Fis family [Solirubrobacterales bacterium]